MKTSEELKKKSVIFIAKEPDKGFGFLNFPINFLILTPKEKITQKMRDLLGQNIIETKSGNTREILADKNTEEILKTKKASILVFKNTKSIEQTAQKIGIKILNPDSEISLKIENKISQFEIFKDLLPKQSRVSRVFDLKPEELPVVLQWNSGHSGDSTMLLKNESDLKKLKEKFPDREAKIAPHLKGIPFTGNAVAFKDKIKFGGPSFQITGQNKLTGNQFSTVGNDFGLPYQILPEKALENYSEIMTEIGNRISKMGFRGIFGIDLIWDKSKETWHLIEINGRQTSSSAFESILSEEQTKNTLFKNHLEALFDLPSQNPLVKIKNGGILILRNQKGQKFNLVEISKKLETFNFWVFTYQNQGDNEEILRIYSKENLMKDENDFNEKGKKILDIIENNKQ